RYSDDQARAGSLKAGAPTLRARLTGKSRYGQLARILGGVGPRDRPQASSGAFPSCSSWPWWWSSRRADWRPVVRGGRTPGPARRGGSCVGGAQPVGAGPGAGPRAVLPAEGVRVTPGREVGDDLVVRADRVRDRRAAQPEGPRLDP